MTTSNTNTNTKKLVINECFGGFALSNESFFEYLKRKGITFYTKQGRFGFTAFHISPDYSNESFMSSRDIPRDCPVLVSMVEEGIAKYDLAKLAVVEIPADVEYTITEYDGYETVEEKHRSWNSKGEICES